MKWLLALFLVTSLFQHANMSTAEATVENDYRSVAMSQWKGGELKLASGWQYYGYKLLKPSDVFVHGVEVSIPHLWNSATPATGFATYRTLVELPDTMRGKKMGLYMPDVYSSYQLWIDGHSYGGNGVVAIDKAKASPMWLPTLITFTAQSKTVEIIIQVSNFHHYRGGIGKPLVLGEARPMIEKAESTRKLGELLFAGLLFIATVSALSYVRQRHPVFIHFSLFCAAWALRSVFSNEYLAVQQFPDINWTWLVRIEYLTLYLSTLFGLLFVTKLFPLDFSRMFKFTYVSIALVFTVLTVSTQPSFFTAYVQIYVAFSATVLVSTVIILIKAFINDRQGATAMLGSIFIGALLFSYVILAYQNLLVLNELIFNIGFLLLFLTLSAGISNHLKKVNRIKQTAMTHPRPVMGLIILFSLIGNIAFSQDTYSGKNLTVQQCLEQAEKYKQAGDIKEATRYLNTAAMQVWEDKNYTDAITYFNQSIELNKKISNLSGIAKINSNLGMIYSDLRQHEKSLEYFQLSLDYRLKHGEKSEIISTYINKGVVLNNLKKYQAAATDIEEALRLATEMNDAAQMKSCYGMLAETYEKAGNQERTLHYFNLYRTFHEMIQRNKVSEATKATEVAQTQALQAELEKKKQEIALLNSNRELAISEEELKKLDQEVRTLLESNTKKELAISLLEREVELDEMRISDVEAKNSIQKTWTIITIVGFVGALLITLLLYRNYRFKKKVNHQLSEQNEEIKTLNENLEVQVVKRTAELQETLTALQNRNRDLDQFSHVISHNLRGPVASILGLGRIIDRENPSDPLNFEIFNKLIIAAQNLDTVVNDLSVILEVKGNQELPKEKIEIAQLVKQSEKLLASEIKKSALHINLSGEATFVEGVKVYLESIIYNLLSNAVKYASTNRLPSMNITSVYENNNKNLFISFADNGIGIPTKDYGKIFQPYKRLNATGGGKGLGLYLVKTQVEAMGGKVSVSGQEGEGTTFTIQLPVS